MTKPVNCSRVLPNRLGRQRHGDSREVFRRNDGNQPLHAHGQPCGSGYGGHLPREACGLGLQPAHATEPTDAQRRGCGPASEAARSVGAVSQENTAGKLFSVLFALASGLVFVGTTGIIIAPWADRLFHWIHIESSS
jgi:hypothetical protein